MSEIGEALGTAVEGGLFAKAVGKGSQTQPEHRELEDGHFAEGACLNCGTELIGSHCHSCGQKAHLHRTVGAFMHDLLHGALHFEGKTWKTLPMLAFKPGELTRRYIEGERKRFVSPMALFLFSIFLMFAVFQVVGLTAPSEIDQAGFSARAKAVEAKAALEQERGAVGESNPERRAEIDDQIDGLTTAIEAIDAGEDYAFRDKDGNRQSQSINLTGIDLIDQGIVKKWRSNPGLMLYKLQANSYKFSWLLIPLSVPFVWLLFFWKRRFGAYDHAIFVTYSIAFMSLLFIVISVLVKIGAPEWLYGTMIAFIPPIHIYKQLRGAYALRRRSAIWRLAVLMIFINIVALLFLQLLLLLGAF
ncbi:DUF3667 domain-containing protein [Qipengyuania sp. G39]|uniref:DUF3667 domain-containing protein n=1 Tax=Qipengyuania profundimaris TaxID=3067652 RepID=A0ABT9HM46_9SPHN|nr:DUF3667 domain-containing protein [Qipengyuania sp. G39]MDP4574070.1 DUF3667 domain-containing protein [Qipengyuania sp. G39]